jgi:D-alanine-D-alanine ligase
MIEIALIYGGDTSEHDISVLSGKNCATLIDKTRYRVHEVELRGPDWKVVACNGVALPGMEMNCGSYNRIEIHGIQINKDDFSYMMPARAARECGIECSSEGGPVRIKFDKVFMMIHGIPGENGLFQAYLEMLGIPCTSCHSLSCALTFQKYAGKQYLHGTGVLMPKDVFIQKGDKVDAADVIAKLGLPVFVKPTDNGSSFGVTKVKKEADLQKAIDAAFAEGSSVLVEECIEGREIGQGVVCYKGEIIALPVTEIITSHEFFDYDAKYMGESEEVCPADITPEQFAALSEESRTIYHHFDCRGMIRIDYKLRGNDPYFLEVNSIPGFTKMSIVPKQLAAAGIDIPSFFTEMIERA